MLGGLYHPASASFSGEFDLDIGSPASASTSPSSRPPESTLERGATCAALSRGRGQAEGARRSHAKAISWSTAARSESCSARFSRRIERLQGDHHGAWRGAGRRGMTRPRRHPDGPAIGRHESVTCAHLWFSAVNREADRASGRPGWLAREDHALRREGFGHERDQETA